MRQEIRDNAFPTEDLATGGASDGVARGLEAEEAGVEGEEGVACQAGGLGAPGAFEEGALVGGEEGEGGVAFALKGEGLSMGCESRRGGKGRGRGLLWDIGNVDMWLILLCEHQKFLERLYR